MENKRFQRQLAYTTARRNEATSSPASNYLQILIHTSSNCSRVWSATYVRELILILQQVNSLGQCAYQIKITCIKSINRLWISSFLWRFPRCACPSLQGFIIKFTNYGVLKSWSFMRCTRPANMYMAIEKAWQAQHKCLIRVFFILKEYPNITIVNEKVIHYHLQVTLKAIIWAVMLRKFIIDPKKGIKFKTVDFGPK